MSVRVYTTITRGPDLISTLPDPILHHILGLLKTKEAVQTCVLSKRWEHLWASVRSLHFDPNDFINWDRYNSLKGWSEQETESLAWSKKFVKFVNAVLRRREPLDLDLFHLSREYLHREHNHHAGDWIHYAIKHHTRVFHLLCFQSLPSCIYNCTSVEKLKISRCEVHISGTVNLPKLRKLVMYFNEDIPFPMNLLSGCFNLESLELNDYVLPDEFVIAHEYLKHLCIINGYTRRLLIDVPNLLSFSFLSTDYGHEYPPPLETVLNTPSLLFARLHSSGFQMSEHMEAVTSILGALSNVELLNCASIAISLRNCMVFRSQNCQYFISFRMLLLVFVCLLVSK